MSEPSYIIWFEELSMHDVDRVGGKNASLGEMIRSLSHLGVRVPGGFATTAQAFRDYLAHNGLTDRITQALERLDVADVVALAETGRQIRAWVKEGRYPPRLEQEIAEAWRKMAAATPGELSVAVRSSATAEDLPDASFAGQQETLLNVVGLANVLKAVQEVFASLYNDRAIAYRVHHGFTHAQVALSAGIQRMVRSDLAASGVMFTLDTESGFSDVVFITGSWGLGEMVVQGAVNPDEFYVHKPMLAQGKTAIVRRALGAKARRMVYGEGGQGTRIEDVPEADRRRFCLTDDEVRALARMAVVIENHYGRPMDIEWAKDGLSQELFIVQARPETVKSRASRDVLRQYRLKGHGRVLVTGRAIGNRIGAGPVRRVLSAAEMHRVQPGDVLVTDMTDPDWEPVMKRAAAIVTNRGGRTCHAAIVARELGIPAVVGTGDATEKLTEDQPVTVSCAEGDTGKVYEGLIEAEVRELSLDTLPEPPVKIMLNVGNPERAFDFAQLPNHGVGLARLEFIINRMIGVHPRAVLDYPALPDVLKKTVATQAAGYADPVTFYVERLAEGVATIAAAFWPKPVIVRLSDFKSNEYANLIGGERYEPREENPMLGLRGAARYVSPIFRDCFALECRALKKVRQEMGYTNVELMIPFVRTVEEGQAVVSLLAEQGLVRGEQGLRVVMMCEIPSNVILAAEFLQHFDGFSIGSNDLTQLTLGIDRDSALVAASFDERNPAVKTLLAQAIAACRQAGKYVGICGQGPSDHPDLAQWLVEQGIESLSLNPDTVVETWLALARPQ
ncbi:phosphoenolpyruvate synthase [Thiobacter aerophilum]|uniref:Phosphoenolpyruvate synthase n=1 Tax=Thiobacter aerophilum TaxID=3121275 RepID=A0ABV0ED56_9BURK